MTGYKAPDLPPEKITPQLVRDELIKCFESANKEFMRILNQPYEDEQLKQQVREFIQGVFQKCGVSFENPTKEGIITAIEECKRNAEQMLGDKAADIIKHHYEEMMKLVSKMPGY